MQVGIDITVSVDLPEWVLQWALEYSCGHWQLVCDWAHLNFTLVCF